MVPLSTELLKLEPNRSLYESSLSFSLTKYIQLTWKSISLSPKIYISYIIPLIFKILPRYQDTTTSVQNYGILTCLCALLLSYKK